MKPWSPRSRRLRFYVDECCPRQLAETLRALGHDVRYAPEAGAGLTDEIHAEIAISERRVVITSDYDFGELAMRGLRPFAGVVLIAPVGVRMAAVAEALALRIDQMQEDLKGYLTILEKKRTRRRPITSPISG